MTSRDKEAHENRAKVLAWLMMHPGYHRNVTIGVGVRGNVRKAHLFVENVCHTLVKYGLVDRDADGKFAAVVRE